MNGYTKVTATAVEIEAFRAKKGHLPTVDRIACDGCAKRIWGSGIGIGSHNRSKACRKQSEMFYNQRARKAAEFAELAESEDRSAGESDDFALVRFRPVTTAPMNTPCGWATYGETGTHLTCGSRFNAVHVLTETLPVAAAGTALCAYHSPFDPTAQERAAVQSVPVAAVVTGERATRLVADAMRFRAYHTRATSPTGMQATRHFRATVKGFNSDYGFACKSWADVAEVTTEVYRLISEQRKAASNG